MGMNNDRDRKLKPHEKAIWRKAFEESMKCTSIEGAERNAWKAVDACYRSGMFHEAESNEKTSSNDDYRKAFDLLYDFMNAEYCDAEYNEWDRKLLDAMSKFASGNLTIAEFKDELVKISID